MGEQIERGQLEGLSSSPFFAIMIDESTDIVVLKEIVSMHDMSHLQQKYAQHF